MKYICMLLRFAIHYSEVNCLQIVNDKLLKIKSEILFHIHDPFKINPNIIS